MTRVLIVDDHISVRDTFKELFSKMEAFEVVGEIANASFAVLYCEQLHPDLVLMDVCTEGGTSGLSAAQQIKKAFPKIKLVMMSGFDEITYAPRAKEIGADAFVYKSKSLEYFAKVIQGVMNGEQEWPETKTVPLPMGETPLSEREIEVIRLLCEHKTRKEIAEKLFISERTVRRVVAQILAKTGFSDSVELAFYMISNGWINPLY